MESPKLQIREGHDESGRFEVTSLFVPVSKTGPDPAAMAQVMELYGSSDEDGMGWDVTWATSTEYGINYILYHRFKKETWE